MKVLRWIWQLPQNIVGFLLSRKPKSQIKVVCNDGELQEVFFTKNVFGCGVSLGDYIILDYDSYYGKAFSKTELTVNHEHGHQKQSRMLGFLYLIVIGIPSVTGNIIDRFFHKRWSYKKRDDWYYKKLPWEAWADKLGGVKR